MEPASLAEPEPSATISLPTFLDTDRLPDLQDAWRALGRSPGDERDRSRAPVIVPPLDIGEPPAHQAEASPARPSNHAIAVRQRAEELSRRFFAGGSGAPPAASGGHGNPSQTALQPSPPAAKSDRIQPAAHVAAQALARQTPAQEPAEPARASEPLPPPYAIGADPSADRGELDAVAAAAPPAHVGAPATSAAESETTTAALPDPALSLGDHRAGLHAALPPLPKRRPELPTASDAGATRRVRTSVSQAPRGPAVKDAKKEVFPHYLQSFGWNARP